MTTQPTNPIGKVPLCDYCNGADPDCKYYDSKNHYVVKPARDNSIDSELEEILEKITQNPNLKLTEIGWESLGESVQEALQAIKALYISRKEVEAAIGALLTRIDYNATDMGEIGVFVRTSYIMNFINDFQAKLLPPTKSGDKK